MTRSTDLQPDMIEDPALIRQMAEAWDGQARQHDRKGKPGIHYFKAHRSEGRHIDCLLHRDAHGRLTGILYHYPFDFPPLEWEGNVNVYVKPSHQGRGIGTLLIIEAIKRWDLNVNQQKYTPAGLAMVDRKGAQAWREWAAAGRDPETMPPMPPKRRSRR